MKKIILLGFLLNSFIGISQNIVYPQSKVPKFKPYVETKRINETLIAKRPITKNTDLTFVYCECDLGKKKTPSNVYEYIYFVEYENPIYNQIVSKSSNEKLFKSWLIFDRVKLNKNILEVLKSNNYQILL